MLQNNAFKPSSSPSRIGQNPSGSGNSGGTSTGAHSTHADFDGDKYINDYRLLDIRLTVMDEEQAESIVELQDVN